jgi:UPF0271 protein
VALRIDLNADVGEGFGPWTMGADEELLPFVSSINVACGFHGGDPRIMDRTVALAVRTGVALGAHPGYWDLRGFGRRALPPDPDEVECDVIYQVGALAAFARAHGAELTHVKPHGALYNQAAKDDALARAVARGVSRTSAGLRFVGLASSAAMRRAARAQGLPFAAEAFVDRRYLKDGSLAPRTMEGALIVDPALAASQAVSVVRERRAFTAEGEEVPIAADTLCLHGDNPRAVDVAWAVRQALESAGIAIQALSR